MTAIGLVTVHHEGAGAPTDEPRGAAGGYTYWIGPAGPDRLRSVAQSWATLHYNHVSVDVCLSGNREIYDVTPKDVASIGAAVADARGRGEVISQPIVRPHRWSPGSSTVCPGAQAMLDLTAIDKACRAAVPHPLPPHPSHPTLVAGARGDAVAVLQHRLNVGAGYHLAEDGRFGPQTLLAVQAFQAFFRLEVDGIAGPHTWEMVDYCYALKGGR